MASNGSYKISISAIDNYSSKLRDFNNKLRATQAPMRNLARQFHQFGELSGFNKLRSSLGSVETGIRRILDPLAAVSSGITALATIKGITSATQAYATQSQQLKNLGAQMGITAKQARVLQGAGEILGNRDSLTNTVSGFQKQLLAAEKNQNPNLLQLQNAAGISDKEMRDPEKAEDNALRLKDYIDKNIKDPQQRATDYRYAGIDTSLMSRSSRDIRRAERQARTNYNSDNIDYEQGDKLKQSFTSLGQTMSGLGDTIASRLAPALTPVVDEFKDWIQTLRSNPDFLNGITNGANALADTLTSINWKQVGQDVRSVYNALGGLKGMLIGYAAIKFGIPAAKVVLELTKIGLQIYAWRQLRKAKKEAADTDGIGRGSGSGGKGGKGRAGRFLKGGAIAAGAAALGYGAYNLYEDTKGERSTKEDPKEKDENIGKDIGETVGPIVGGAIGTALGAIIPGLGETGLGEYLGGAAGSWAGSKVGGSVGGLLGRGYNEVKSVFSGHSQAAAPVVGTPGEDALSIAKQNGFDPKSFTKYAQAVASIESGGRKNPYNMMGGFHNAYAGKYQMSRDAIQESASSLGEKAPDLQTFLHDPQMQERYFAAYSMINNKRLQNTSPEYRGLSQDQQLANLAYAHNQGAGGDARYLRTGVSGQDGFGTAGTLYLNRVLQTLGDGDQAQLTPVKKETSPSPTVDGDNSDVDVNNRGADVFGGDNIGYDNSSMMISSASDSNRTLGYIDVNINLDASGFKANTQVSGQVKAGRINYSRPILGSSMP